MHVIQVRNVEQALPMGLEWLRVAGIRKDSRNGPVLASPCPVTTVYTHPMERVLRHPLRDANPVFHFMEAMWMLAGRDDVAFPSLYAKQIAEYSDDGSTLWGAYGCRWRCWFSYDQLDMIVGELAARPDSRRCVLAMWDGSADLPTANAGGKDVPCNTQAFFSLVDGKLQMTVCNRSNDVVWGAYGANAVHFSILQEYVAAALGVPVGRYYQISNDYHIYITRPDVQRLFGPGGDGELGPVLLPDPSWASEAPTVVPRRLFNDVERFNFELEQFFMAYDAGGLHLVHLHDCTEPAIRAAVLMEAAHSLYRAGDLVRAIDVADMLELPDWRLAVMEWLERRAAQRAAKKVAP